MTYVREYFARVKVFVDILTGKEPATYEKGEQIPETKETFYRKCIENGCREILPDYVWNKQFNNQMSYAFSIPHCTAYSWILCQEAWLYTIYPSVYWNTAVLQVNSGSIEEEGKKEAQSNTAKISSAIGQLQATNLCICLERRLPRSALCCQ